MKDASACLLLLDNGWPVSTTHLDDSGVPYSGAGL